LGKPGNDSITVGALEAFPDALEAHYLAVPPEWTNWVPGSWEGMPSERLSAIEQICHLLDIEREGYHVRFRRILEESTPVLESIDSERLARERSYASARSGPVLAAFRRARAESVALIRGLDASQLARTARFAEHGTVSLRSLIHLLCSHDQQHLAGLQWLLARIAAQVG
jgi:DinB superfamily